MTAPELSTFLRRARHRLRTRASEHPSVYLPFARWKYPGPSPMVIGQDTELVVDGYTRSASTFAVYALQLAQERPLRLAHHLHAPAQLVAAARADLPALLVIREPRDAILSHVVREPGVVIRDALDAYIRFHETLRPHRERMVVGDFRTVTHDFGAVIARLNERFGLTLREFVPTPQNLAECFAFIEQRGSLSSVLLGFESGLVTRSDALAELHRRQQVEPPGTLREAWKPSAERRRKTEALAEQWSARSLARLRERADALYARFTADAVAAVEGT
ncbi:MAG: hypothetical protein ABI232_06585 [Jatrophihabitantaceae bacterium]